MADGTERRRMRFFDYGTFRHAISGREHPDFGTLKNPRTPTHWKRFFDRLER